MAWHVLAGGTPGYDRSPLLDFSRAEEESVSDFLKRRILEVRGLANSATS